MYISEDDSKITEVLINHDAIIANKRCSRKAMSATTYLFDLMYITVSPYSIEFHNFFDQKQVKLYPFIIEQ